MRRLILLALFSLWPVHSLAAEFLSTPLYQHLLKQAQQRLAARAAVVSGLVGAASGEAYRDGIRIRIAEAIGAFPERTPLNARTVWTREFEGYRIEGVLFESRPGLYVTAHLYLPTHATPPYPAILGPCGHSLEGKAGPTYQPAWINLARRGFAVLTFDPIGQGERVNYLEPEGKVKIWGTTEHTMLGTKALLLGHSLARDILWDGVRAIDYLETRPDIDKSRIGCTGNSGGGTQTAQLMAVDRRIVCAAPSCYLTTYSRLLSSIGPQDAEQNLIHQVAAGLDHADFIAACLPSPVLVCAASDDYFDIRGTWETYREAKVFYGKAGMAHRLDLFEGPDGHGFSPPRRTAVYHWMARWLQGRVDEEPEPATEIVTAEKLWVTESGQVLQSIPGARSMNEVYREEAAALAGRRTARLASLDAAAFEQELVRTLGIRNRKTPTFAESGTGTATGGIVQSTHTAEIEPGWNVTFTLARIGDSPVNRVIVRVRDATVMDTPGAGTRVAARVAVADVFPRGLTDPERLGGKGTERYFGDWRTAFLALHIGRPLIGQRAEDVLAVCDHLKRAFPEAAIELEAEREAVPAAIVAALLEPGISSLAIRQGLSSWQSVIDSEMHVDVVSNVAVGMLGLADLPDLIARLGGRDVRIVEPRGAE